jgi:hypothetical protein
MSRRARAAKMFSPRESMLAEAAERLEGAMKEAKRTRPWDMKAIWLAARRYLADFEEAWRRWPSTAEEEETKA